LARIAAYSFCRRTVRGEGMNGRGKRTYGSILGSLSITALQCNAVTLMLQTLWSDQSLNLRGLGVWLLALALWLDLTTDNKLSDL
jgi:hypothetical protein